MERGRKARAFSYEKAGARSPGLKFLRRVVRALFFEKYPFDYIDEKSSAS